MHAVSIRYPVDISMMPEEQFYYFSEHLSSIDNKLSYSAML